MRADDYLRYYKKLPHKRYESRPAIQVSGEFLPFDQMAVLHGTFHVDDLRNAAKRWESVSRNTWRLAFVVHHPDRDRRKRDEASGSVKSSGESEKFFRVGDVSKFLCGHQYLLVGAAGTGKLFGGPGGGEPPDGRTDREGAPGKTISYNVGNEKNGMCGRSHCL